MLGQRVGWIGPLECLFIKEIVSTLCISSINKIVGDMAENT
jgi:hypothetical protein